MIIISMVDSRIVDFRIGAEPLRHRKIVAGEDRRRRAGLCIDRLGGRIFLSKVDHSIGAEQRHQQQAGSDAGEKQPSQ
jgi:hypothetical protein